MIIDSYVKGSTFFAGAAVALVLCLAISHVAMAGDAASAVSPECTEIAKHLVERASALCNSRVDLIAINGVAEVATVSRIKKAINGFPADFDADSETAEIKSILMENRPRGLSVIGGTIDSRSDGQYIAHWKRLDGWDTSGAPATTEPTRDWDNTAIVRKFDDGSYAVIFDQKTIALLRSTPPPGFAELSTIDVSLNDWLQMIRLGAAPNQRIAGKITPTEAILYFGDADPKIPFDTQYVFRPELHYAPEKVVVGLKSEKEGNEDAQLSCSYTAAAKESGAPIAFMMQTQDAGNGAKIVSLYIVKRWEQIAAKAQLDRIRVPFAFTLSDSRFSDHSLVQEFPATSGERYLDDIVATPK